MTYFICIFYLILNKQKDLVAKMQQKEKEMLEKMSDKEKDEETERKALYCMKKKLENKQCNDKET